jgi:3-oxoacyl-[acyl-carrier protein] reductase
VVRARPFILRCPDIFGHLGASAPGAYSVHLLLFVVLGRPGCRRGTGGDREAWGVTNVGEAVIRVAVVTGVSRRQGIGCAIARRLLDDGLSVLIQSWAAHDAEQPWSPGAGELAAVIEELGGLGDRLDHIEVDFSAADAPRQVIDRAVDRFGGVDVLVANHAMSAPGRLEQVTAEQLDAAWAVNARATVLLVQAFAGRHDDSRPDGRVLLFTSGQHLGPMADELPYAISKGAVHEMTASLADALADRAITLNAVNPGPVDTGWPTDELRKRLRSAFPGGRWGQPQDIAKIVSWLVSPDSGWITGQVIDVEGGFRR